MLHVACIKTMPKEYVTWHCRVTQPSYTMINVIVVEDDLTIQGMLAKEISQSPEIKLAGAFGSIEEARTAHATITPPPDVIIMDIVLPGLSGIDGIRIFRNLWPGTNIIMFSVMDDGFNLFRSLCEGAVGYLTKEASMDDIRTAIRDVHEGKGSMSPTIARKIADFFHSKRKVHEVLTAREQDIVDGIIEGLSYKLLASKLNISLDTVRKHIKNIYRKLHINSKAQLMQQYFS